MMSNLYDVEIHILVKKVLKDSCALQFLKNDEIKEMLLPKYSSQTFLKKALLDYNQQLSVRRYLKLKIAEDVVYFAKQLNSEDTLYRRIKAYCASRPKSASNQLMMSPISTRHLYKDYQQLTISFQNLGIFKDAFFDAFIQSKMKGDFTTILSCLLKQNNHYHEAFTQNIDPAMTENRVEQVLNYAYYIASKLMLKQIDFDASKVVEYLKKCRDDFFLSVFSNYVAVLLAIEAKAKGTIPPIDFLSQRPYLSDLKMRFNQLPLHLKAKKRASSLDAIFELHPIIPEAYCLSYQYGVQDHARDAWIMTHVNLIVHHMQMNLDRFETHPVHQSQNTQPSIAYLDAFMQSGVE